MPFLPVIFSVLSAISGLTNGSFEEGLNGWEISSPQYSCKAMHYDGKTVATIIVLPTQEVSFPSIYQILDVAEGDILEAHAVARHEDFSQGYGAYMCFEFFDADSKRMNYSQSPQLLEKDQWVPVTVRAVAPPGVKSARLLLLMNGFGRAFFDDVTYINTTAEPLARPEGAITLTLTDQVMCESFNGFGAEDDGWFYNEENTSHDVTPEDYPVREGRIEWMDPDWTRMFFWHRDWCPTGDWKTFTFESDNMKSHYRTLDLYQRIGSRVNITGTEWGMQGVYDEPESYVHAVGELFEHLIRHKGYTCISDWTLTNEPNGAFTMLGYSHDQFTLIHQLMKKEFERRGLKIRLTGSDDAQDLHWFAKCVENQNYYDSVDLFSSHSYFPYADRILAGRFYEDRLNLLRRKQPEKPFIMGEFGFHDDRSGTHSNPSMECYPYALWTCEVVLEGLNRGVAGFSIWALHEVYYPGNVFMNYALWDFKDNNWKPRPVYYAWSNFSRLTEAGDRVRKVESSHPRLVKAAVVGKTLFFVNSTVWPVQIELAGFNGKEGRIYTEKTLHGDRECGEQLRIEGHGFSLPPESFGFLLDQ